MDFELLGYVSMFSFIKSLIARCGVFERHVKTVLCEFRVSWQGWTLNAHLTNETRACEQELLKENLKSCAPHSEWNCVLPLPVAWI